MPRLLDTAMRLSDIPPRFAGATVLVLGDVMLDRFVTGEAHRLSPEAPIPILRAQGARSQLGGAANVAHNVASLGARAILLGVVGADAAGGEIERLLAGLGARIEGRLLVASDRPTTVKTRFMAGSHQLLRVDEESAAPLDERQVAQLMLDFESALAVADIVVLSDYAKGVLDDRVLSGAIARARQQGRPVLADPKRLDFSAYRGVSLLTPNVLEVSRATGIDAADDAGAVAAGLAALDQAQSEALLVTRSEKGLTLLRRDSAPLHLPTEAREVADVTGAGDTLVAALATALAAGVDLPTAAHIGNLAAGIAVSRHGTVAVSGSVLAHAIADVSGEGMTAKVRDLPGALDQIAAWRADGLRIGFTNGCFDLIHPGHVALLAEARAACDRLVVGLNSDASVRRLKGEGRPVQNETARAVVMASFAAADLVVLFEEDTPIALITAILPDVLVKGADYSIDQVVGAEIVQAHGGKVLLVDVRAGHSTTSTIRRIGQSGRPQPSNGL